MPAPSPTPVPPAPLTAGSPERLAHKFHFRRSAGKIRIALVWSQGFPASPCRRSGSGINRPSSERREGGEGREGRAGKEGRQRGKVGEGTGREREGGRDTGQSESGQPERRGPEATERAWAAGQGVAGWLRQRSRQASEHSPHLSPLLPHFPVGRWALMDPPVCVTWPQPLVEGQCIKTPTNTG